MSAHAALTAEAHRDVRINTQRSAALGDSVMSCITFPGEFRNLQNCYPILFQLSPDRSEYRAVALFGFERGQNLFLDGTSWDARYLPLAMEIHPFLVGLPRQPGGEPQVHIDMSSPRVSADDGVRIFEDSGRPTDFLNSMSEKLGALHQGFQRSSDYSKALQKYDLLEPFVLEVELNDGSKHRLVGFHTINEENLAALDAAALSDLHEQSFLMPTFMAVASLSNFVNLIARRNALAAHV